MGGRPLHAPPAFIPITFELAVLLAVAEHLLRAAGAVRLPQPYHPVFEHEEFRSAVHDGFWLSVAAPTGRGRQGREQHKSRQLGGREVSTSCRRT